MKLLLDDTTARAHGLNANEACVYAAILKCTKSGRGWFANYRDLANALPFVISRMTVTRAVEKLLNLGLIERRDNALFAHAQIEQIGAQNEQDNAQNEQIGAQIEQNIAPPNNPLIINNIMNEKEKEQPRALCTHDGNEQQGADYNFEMFWKYFSESMPAEFHNRKGATKIAFEKRSEVAQRAMIEAAQEGAPGHPGDEQNPYFFVVDFPEPKPTWLRGDESGDIVQVRYNGAYKLCTRATMELFGLEWVRDW